MNKIFVYGTLMKGFWNYKRYLEGRISRIIPGRTDGLLYHLPEGYPGLLSGKGIVEGEIMEPVDEALLCMLDRLEVLYTRKARRIMTDAGDEMVCWVYFYTDKAYAQENGTLVTNGNWKTLMDKRGETELL